MSSTASSPTLLAALLLATACGGSDKPDAEEPASPGDNSAYFSPSSTDDEEEEPTDIEVEGLKGRLEPHQIEAGVKPHQDALAACYRDELKRARFLGGTITLKAQVGPEGTVLRATISESDLGSWPVERCLLEITRSMQFSPPKGGDRHADFTLPLDFNSGRGRVIWWTEDKIEAHVSQKMETLDACAEETEGQVPSNVWVTVYLGNRGAVKSVGFSSPAEAEIDEAWADCAAETVKGWALADPMGKIAKTAFRFRPE